jgi:hypothetical protein
MLDVALDPAFEQNKTIYWAFSEKQQDSTNLYSRSQRTINRQRLNQYKTRWLFFRATPALKSESTLWFPPGF